MKTIRIILALLLSAVPAFSNTYYISSSTGLDTRTSAQAQSKSTPWAHVPGMANATSNASTYTAVAGDNFILMGCDVWYNASFPLALSFGGSTGNVVTVGVDQTWFNATNCPSTWNRPIFDAHMSSGSSTPTQIGGTGCTNNNMFVQFGASWITMDNVEMRNLFYHNDAENSCYGGNLLWEVTSSDHVTVSNSYEHGWAMNLPYNSSTSNDTDILVNVSGSPLCPNCLLTKNVADNCATTSGNGTLPGGALNMINITYSIFTCMANAYKPTIAGEFGWNNISFVGDSPDPTIHPNCIETLSLATGTGTYHIHDNRVHDAYGCEGLQIGNPGETDYVWNNIWYNMTVVGANGPQVPQSLTPVAMYFWNNTIVVPRWSGCITDAAHGYTWSGPFQSINNLCINTAGSNSSQSSTHTNPVSAPTAVLIPNTGLTTSTATSDGYTNAQPFVYSPTSAGSPSVGAGINLTSRWPAGFTTVDSHIICTEQTISGVVQSVCTGTANTRPGSGAWDVGAYEFTGSVTPTPSAPINRAILLTF